MLGAEAATSVYNSLYQEIPEQKIVIENINDEELDEWAPRESVTHPKLHVGFSYFLTVVRMQPFSLLIFKIHITRYFNADL